MFDKPLAFRMRPTTMEEVLGQEKIKTFLNNLIENNTLVSMVFFGPPGTGKTTLINMLSTMMAGRRKLFLTKTHTALQNLQRRIENPGADVL